MNADEYARLADVDQEHWFYRGKREIVRHWIQRFRPLDPEDLLIDAGCGTGILATEMTSQCRVVAVDDHEESLALTRPRVLSAGGEVLRSDLSSIPLDDGCASAITALDVLEHLDDDDAAVREFSRLLEPGGLLVVTVPALMILWSDWDETLHHRRRYDRKGLLRALSQPGLEILRCTYFNTLAFFGIAAIRSWRKVRPPQPGALRAEDRIPGRLANTALRKALVWPARIDALHPPFGVSLLGIARRASDTVE